MHKECQKTFSKADIWNMKKHTER